MDSPVPPKMPPIPPRPGDKPTQSRRHSWKTWAVAGLALAGLIFVVQNSQKVEVDFVFASTNTPLFFALLIAMVIGFTVGWLLPRLRRDS